MSRIGDMVFSDPPGSFGAMSEYDKLEFTMHMNALRQKRLERERKAGESVVAQTVEIEGDDDERKE